MVLNYHLTIKYNLKIGLLDQANFELLNRLIIKPYTHLANIGLAGLLATLYYEILVFRRIDS